RTAQQQRAAAVRPWQLYVMYAAKPGIAGSRIARHCPRQTRVAAALTKQPAQSPQPAHSRPWFRERASRSQKCTAHGAWVRFTALRRGKFATLSPLRTCFAVTNDNLKC